MIHINFHPDALTDEQKIWWDDWQNRADAEIKNIIKAWETYKKNKTQGKFQPDFNDDVWKELRDWLLANVFNNKCAYCETPIVRATFHAEHFRPKGQVKFKPAESKRMKKGIVKDEMAENETERNQEVEHPGYFWLAYHWKNLLPSCEFCNTAKGKKDQFPVKNQYVAVKRIKAEELSNLRQAIIKSEILNDIFYLQPDDLDILEGRLLLHPYEDDPQQHLKFGVMGIVSAREGSEKGLHSIKVYDLNGDELKKARAEAQSAARTFYLSRIAVAPSTPRELKEAAEEALAPYRQGLKPYSAAVLDYLHEILKGSMLDPDVPLEAVPETN